MIKLNLDTGLTTLNGREVEVKSGKKTGKKVRPPTSRKWCFTSFKALDFSVYGIMFNEHSAMLYMILGLETCPKTGRQHIQGFVHLNSGYKLSTLKTWFHMDETIHFEICKGTAEDNIKYCSKEGNFIEYGERQFQGKRNDITTKLSKHKTLNDFIKNETDTYVKYRSGVEGYYRAKGVDYDPMDDKPLVIWLWGDTGTGKSRTVRDYLKIKIADGYRVWRRPLGATSWFDGYAGQDIVYLDEVRGSTYKFDDLLQMLDYDCPQVPVKGSFVDFRPKVILITSNAHPRDVYSGVNAENKQQLVRRCDKVYHVKKYVEGLLT